MTDIWYKDTDHLLEEIRRLDDDPARPQIPGYDNLREIGRGGQGVVYRARQASSGRDVAIKVLLEGVYASESSRRRFEREIELVAELTHPNIVRVLESGQTADARPFLVMEFVEGDSLDEGVKRWSDDRKRLLESFATICEAVGHAHQRGVMHRDLKPGNIRIDDVGAVRVLDFGLAKTQRMPDPDPDAPTAVSVTGEFLGSLPWSSPEQAAGDAVDVRSDVYSIGVLLYKALSGEFPYRVTGSLRDVLHRIAHEEPARLRSIDPTIDDDLQTIVLRCLAKDPDRRYQSALDVAREIRRYVAGEPIEAKRDSALYSLRKTMARHRVTVAGGSVALVALIAFSVTMALLYQRAVGAESLAQGTITELEAERTKVALVNEYLLGAFSPSEDDEDPTVGSMLDRAAGRVAADLSEQPDVRAEVHNALSYWFSSFSRDADAMQQQELSLHYRRQVHGDDDERLIENHRSLSFLNQRRDETELAIEHAEEWARLERLHHPESQESANPCGWLAELQLRQGNHAEAQRMAHEALRIREQALEPGHWLIHLTRGMIAVILAAEGRFDEADPMLVAAYDAAADARGESNGSVRWLRTIAAEFYEGAGRTSPIGE